MADRPPRVSVLMAAYNAAETIGRAIDSCLQQTFGDWELVVVDDGSADGTTSLVAAMDDRRVRLVTLEQNQGESAARNAAIEASRGAWLTVLDADDAFLPTRLERLLGLAEELGRTEYVFVDRMIRVLATPAGFVPLSHLPEHVPVGHQVLEPAAAVRHGLGGQPFFSRQLLDTSGASYPTYSRSGQDIAFLLRLLGADRARFVRVHDPLYLYATHDGSMSRLLDRHDERMAAFEPLLNDLALPVDLRDAIARMIADLQRGRPFEELRAALLGRHPLRAVAVTMRHPGVLRDLGAKYRTHRRYRTALTDAQRFASGLTDRGRPNEEPS